MLKTLILETNSTDNNTNPVPWVLVPVRDEDVRRMLARFDLFMQVKQKDPSLSELRFDDAAYWMAAESDDDEEIFDSAHSSKMPPRWIETDKIGIVDGDIADSNLYAEHRVVCEEMNISAVGVRWDAIDGNDDSHYFTEVVPWRVIKELLGS